MGNGITHVFSQNNFAVTLVDVSQQQLNKAIATIGKNMDRQVAKGSLTEAKQSALFNLTTHTTCRPINAAQFFSLFHLKLHG